jgi:hypothetical protein
MSTFRNILVILFSSPRKWRQQAFSKLHLQFIIKHSVEFRQIWIFIKTLQKIQMSNSHTLPNYTVPYSIKNNTHFGDKFKCFILGNSNALIIISKAHNYPYLVIQEFISNKRFVVDRRSDLRRNPMSTHNVTFKNTESKL